jgi:hypothetical protein
LLRTDCEVKDVFEDPEYARRSSPRLRSHATPSPGQTPINHDLEADEEFEFGNKDKETESFLRTDCKLKDLFEGPECARRMMIAYHFASAYGAKEDCCKEFPWYGEHGVINSLRKELHLTDKRAIVNVLERAVECRRNDKPYDPHQKVGAGRKSKLSTVDSVETHHDYPASPKRKKVRGSIGSN